MPVNGAVTVEEARSLATGVRDIAQSGYIHTDLRGSIVLSGVMMPHAANTQVHFAPIFAKPAEHSHVLRMRFLF